MNDRTLSAGLPRQPASPGPHHDDAGDSDLIRRISCADRGALEQLYFRYHKWLVKFLSCVIRRHADLEEVINDTFLIVWQHAGDFGGASHVSTWIFGIAYRRALTIIRMSPAWERETGDGRLPEFGISRLSPDQRLVITLAYCMHYSCEEIAAIVACPIDTVKARMWHARRELRAIMSAAAAPHDRYHGIACAQTQDLDLQ